MWKHIHFLCLVFDMLVSETKLDSNKEICFWHLLYNATVKLIGYGTWCSFRQDTETRDAFLGPRYSTGCMWNETCKTLSLGAFYVAKPLRSLVSFFTIFVVFGFVIFFGFAVLNELS
jgi:hypothetical protein